MLRSAVAHGQTDGPWLTWLADPSSTALIRQLEAGQPEDLRSAKLSPTANEAARLLGVAEVANRPAVPDLGRPAEAGGLVSRAAAGATDAVLSPLMVSAAVLVSLIGVAVVITAAVRWRRISPWRDVD